MSRRRRRRRSSSDEVSLNMAAMLDMAFQLLTFFILTFKPATIEQQIVLKLPPPEKIKSDQPSAKSDPTDIDVALKTLRLTADAAPDGKLAGLSFADTGERARNLDDLETKMKRILSAGDKDTKYEQVVVEIDPRLNLQEVMLVIDRCLRQKLADGKPLTKISPVLRKAGS